MLMLYAGKDVLGWEDTVLLYAERWLKAGIMQVDGCYLERESGTPQGGVISPLLANLYLHVAFDG
jgi:RNA-directed DNA polymerase